MKKFVWFTLIACLCLMPILLTGCQPAEPTQNGDAGDAVEADEAVFKDGDIIKIIVGFGPGGGYDSIARLIQPYLEAKISEITGSKISVIVENMPGAGGVMGYATCYNAKPDGKTLAVVGMSSTPFQALKTGEFVLEEFTPIARLNTDLTVLVATGDPGITSITSWDELVQQGTDGKSLLVATTGLGTGMFINSTLTKIFLEEAGLDLNMDFVNYDSASTAMLSVVKGETQISTADESTALELIKSGDLKAIVVYGTERSGILKDVPTLIEANVPGAEELAEIIGNHRLFMAPPGLPENIAGVLREATEMALNDPDLLRVANDMGLPVGHADHNYVNDLVEVRNEVAERFLDLVY